MIFLEQYNFLLKLFYFIGLKPAVKSRTKMGKLADLVPAIVTSLLCIALSVYLLFFPHFASYGIVFAMIFYGSLIPSLLMILSATIQCYFKKNDYKTILNQIGKLEKQLDEKSTKLCIKCVAFRYNIKFVILYIVFFISQLLVFVEVKLMHPGRVWSSIGISLIRATYPIQLLHFVLYGDTATMFLHQLNRKFRQTPIFIHKSGKIEFLKYVKLMHYELWKLVDGINKFFGWNLVFISMYWFIHITHQSYWVFLHMNSNPHGLELVG